MRSTIGALVTGMVAVILVIAFAGRTTRAAPQSAYYTGCVRQLDANKGGHLQAVLEDPDNATMPQLVVISDDPTFKALLNTAFLWGTKVHVDYDDQASHELMRLKLDKFYTAPCSFPPPKTGQPK